MVWPVPICFNQIGMTYSEGCSLPLLQSDTPFEPTTGRTRWHTRPLFLDAALRDSHLRTRRVGRRTCLALCELWVIIAAHSGIVGAWRLAGVCRAARRGAKEWLRTLPRFVVCGGQAGGGVHTRTVWRLDLGELRSERLPDLTTGRAHHFCCAVRGGVVVLGGSVLEAADRRTLVTRRERGVEILGRDSPGAEVNIFKVLPPLSCGPIQGSAVVVIDESDSDQGQVLLIGGRGARGESTSAVRKVDLATGDCTVQPALLCPQGHVITDSMAGRLPDGRIVCTGTNCIESFIDESYDEEKMEYDTMAQVLEPPPHGSPSGASWQWRALPGMSVPHDYGGRGCVLSDGRFAVFGGVDASGSATMSCEALTLDADSGRWGALPPMHEQRWGFACVAVGGCVIVAGGGDSITAEVYEEGLERWRRLPCSLPHDGQLYSTGSALL